MVGIVHRLSNRFVHQVGSLGLAAAAVLALSMATAPRAQALSPIGAPATAAAKIAGDHTIQVQLGKPVGGGFHGGGGGFHGGGFRGGGPALGGGGFRGGGPAFHGGGFRGGPVLGGGFRPAFRGGAIYRGGGFRYAAPIYRPHFAPIRHYGYRRHHFAPRYYGFAPYYGIAPYYGYSSYYDYAPRYYYPRRSCRIVYTYYGPRQICRYKPWRHHLRRHHHRKHHHHIRRIYY